MDSLNIAGKAVRLCIDNDESRVIEFYPTDVSFAENFYALAAEFEERQNVIRHCGGRRKQVGEIAGGAGAYPGGVRFSERRN